MFISIPKEFFVPVIFGEGFILNEENNNLELDTNFYRESSKAKTKNNSENINTYDEEKINTNKNNKKLLEKMDVEEKTINENKQTKESPMYIPLKKEENVDFECVNTGDMFSDLDDEYIEGLDNKKQCDI